VVKKIVNFFVGLVIAGTCIAADNHQNSEKCLGLFRQTDPRLDGITYGNWGSCPYEYSWVKSCVSVAGKKVIDLGVGLPSQYNWYHHVVATLNPLFYAGIDVDTRIKNEEVIRENYEIRHMDMANLRYPDRFFDIAFCISTFEHVPLMAFMKCIKEAHRVLKDGGTLVVTLDEWWDKDQRLTHANGWNTLEQDLIKEHMLDRSVGSFGLPDFLALVKDYFVPTIEATIDVHNKTITSTDGLTIYYKKNNRDVAILNSGAGINSCVSYVILKKVEHTLNKVSN
jgi:SAM-dependent methyltransferase